MFAKAAGMFIESDFHSCRGSSKPDHRLSCRQTTTELSCFFSFVVFLRRSWRSSGSSTAARPRLFIPGAAPFLSTEDAARVVG